jgi:hypothetical protein
MMAAFEFHPLPLSRTVEIWTGNACVGAVTYDETRREWLAEADGESRYCVNFGMALGFIEAVTQTGDWLDLRFTNAAVH